MELLDAPIRLSAYSHGGGCGCKIAPGVLSEILKTARGLPIPKELMVGIETSDDAAVYILNENQALIATTDFFMPIVDDPYDFGRIAATNAISDVYAMGGTPIMALALLAMPIDKLPVDIIGKIIQGGESICAEAGIPIAGGHTIDSVEPIYGLVAIGLIHPKNVKRNSDAKVGDRLILSKPIGVGVMSAALKQGKLDAAGYADMLRYTTMLNRPGIQMAELEGVHAMTDVTGFGLLGHALEIARGSHLKIRLNASDIPVISGVHDLLSQGFVTGASARNWAGYGNQINFQATNSSLMQALLTDPQTAGGLLVSCSVQSVNHVLETFHQAGFIHACDIGEVLNNDLPIDLSIHQPILEVI